MPYDKAALCIQLAGNRSLKKHEGSYKVLPFISFSVAPLKYCMFAKHVPHIKHLSPMHTFKNKCHDNLIL